VRELLKGGKRGIHHPVDDTAHDRTDAGKSVVELLCRLGRLAAYGCTKTVALVCIALESSAALVEQRDQVSARLSEDRHRERRLCRTVLEARETIGHIGEHRVRGAEVAEAIFHRNAQRLKRSDWP